MDVHHSQKRRRFLGGDSLEPIERHALYVAAGLFGVGFAVLTFVLAPVIWGAM